MIKVNKLAFFACLSLLALCLGCSSNVTTENNSSNTPYDANNTEDISANEDDGSAIADLFCQIEDTSANISYDIDSFLEEGENAKLVYASLGQQLQATDNLSVAVLSVSPGPYDYFDKTETVKVTVSMTNTSDKTIWVKASNWDADTSNGTRVDHKITVFGEDLKPEVSSFTIEHLYPDGTFIGDLYFDASSLVAIVYEPHWLISSQNQYLYWYV